MTPEEQKLIDESFETMDLESEDLVADRVEQIKALFPEVAVEGDGTIDFEKLRLILGDEVDEGQERYAFTWPGKADAIRQAQTPSTATLRPDKADSVDWDTTENLYIEGDNLEVLKLLQRGYHGKVKMIYIDPPYNTGHDFVYKDSFGDTIENYKEQAGLTGQSNADTSGRYHSDWLSMMYPRLRLARELLADDGIILINIDENEITNLQNLIGEIFGEANDLGVVVWDKRNPKGDAQGISVQHEYIVFYSKNKDAIADKHVLQRPKRNAQMMLDKAKELFESINLTYTLDDANRDYKTWIKSKTELSGGERAYNNIDADGHVFRPVSMAWPNKQKAPDDYFIPLMHPITGKPCPVPSRGWRNPPATMQSLLEKGLILFGSDETTQPNRKYLLEENMMENIPSLLYFGGSDTEMLAKMGIPFDTPKVTRICQEHIQALSDDNDIVLDFFSGSGTTAHATILANLADGKKRKMISVQLPEPLPNDAMLQDKGFANLCDVGEKRIRKAGEAIQNEEGDSSVDIGFRVLKLDSSNFDDVSGSALYDNIVKSDRSHDDIIFEMMLKWGLDLSLPMESVEIEGYPATSVAADELICCMDEGLTVPVLEAIAAREPKRVFFLDSILNDTLKLNAAQIFKRVGDKLGYQIELRTV